MLKHDIFVRIYKQFLNPDIDLFASCINRQMRKFVSWSFDPDAFHIDAFTFKILKAVYYLVCFDFFLCFHFLVCFVIIVCKGASKCEYKSTLKNCVPFI